MTKPNQANYKTRILNAKNRDEVFWRDLSKKVYKDTKKDSVATAEIMKKMANEAISQIEFNITPEEDQILSDILSENSFEAWIKGFGLLSDKIGCCASQKNKPVTKQYKK